MYCYNNYPTKKALKDAVAAGKPVEIYSPGLLGRAKENGTEYVEGPHYPQPHRWYAQVTMQDGLVVRVK